MTDAMPSDEAPPEAIASGFARLIGDLRDDVREDLRDIRAEITHSEERVTARVAVVEARQIEAREQLVEFARTHADEHEKSDRRSADNHSALWVAVRKFELDQARRDGALGVVRYLLELTSRHAPRLIAIVVAMAGLLGVILGEIQIEIGHQ